MKLGEYLTLREKQWRESATDANERMPDMVGRYTSRANECQSIREGLSWAMLDINVTFQVHDDNKQYCLQCGAELLLDAVPINPDLALSQTVSACHACHSRAYNTPGNKIMELTKQRDELLAALTHAATDYIDQNGSVPSWWTDKIRQLVKPEGR